MIGPAIWRPWVQFRSPPFGWRPRPIRGLSSRYGLSRGRRSPEGTSAVVPPSAGDVWSGHPPVIRLPLPDRPKLPDGLAFRRSRTVAMPPAWHRAGAGPTNDVRRLREERRLGLRTTMRGERLSCGSAPSRVIGPCEVKTGRVADATRMRMASGSSFATLQLGAGRGPKMTGDFPTRRETAEFWTEDSRARRLRATRPSAAPTRTQKPPSGSIEHQPSVHGSRRTRPPDQSKRPPDFGALANRKRIRTPISRTEPRSSDALIITHCEFGVAGIRVHPNAPNLCSAVFVEEKASGFAPATEHSRAIFVVVPAPDNTLPARRVESDLSASAMVMAEVKRGRQPVTIVRRSRAGGDRRYPYLDSSPGKSAEGSIIEFASSKKRHGTRNAAVIAGEPRRTFDLRLTRNLDPPAGSSTASAARLRSGRHLRRSLMQLGGSPLPARADRHSPHRLDAST